MPVLISLPCESTSVFSGVRNEISMSVIQSQCAVACSTMPLQIKFFTTAALERGRWGRRTGLVTGTLSQCHHPMTTVCSKGGFIAIIASPTSPEGPSSAAVVNQSPGETHITSWRYNMQWRLRFSKINCYLFTSRISYDISRREPEGILSFCLSRCQCNRRSLSHPQILLKSPRKSSQKADASSQSW